MKGAFQEDWDNPWYATWRFSLLSRPAKAAVMAFIDASKKEQEAAIRAKIQESDDG